MTKRRKQQRGSSIIEFVFIAVPLIFVMISTFEMGRAMWTYQTLAHAVKEAARYAAVHGNGCTSLGNTCGIEVADVATRFQNGGPGLIPAQVSLTLTDASGSTTCATLATCLSNTANWPSTAGGSPGSTLTVTARYQFPSPISMFWPGAGATAFGAISFPASARESVQF